VTYWDGVRSRLLPAALLGLVVVLLTGLITQWVDGLVVGTAAFLAAALMPSRRVQRPTDR
jgi:hypothetical protein